MSDQLAYAPEAAGLPAVDQWAAVGIPFGSQQGAAPQQSANDPWAALGIPVTSQAANAEPPIALEPGEHVLTVG